MLRARRSWENRWGKYAVAMIRAIGMTPNCALESDAIVRSASLCARAAQLGR